MTSPNLSRRGLLAAGAGLSVTLLGGNAAFAAPGEKKLVMIVARGGLDGMSLAPPVGDPNYAALRGPIAIPAEAALKLDGTFGLHPKLAALYALTQAGQARIAPAVAIPERIRSHFEAQDLLENGGTKHYGLSTGWLNRSLDAGPRLKGLSVGAQTPLILRGRVQAQSWSPGGRFDKASDHLIGALQDLYADDPMLGRAFASGLQTEAMADDLSGGQPIDAKAARDLAVTAAKFLSSPGGPSIAVLSLNGFDTHAAQGAAEGQLAQRLKTLDETIAGFQQGLGAEWKNTVLIVATEFGRTARVNGTLGLDHGTGAALVLAGGALKPGGIVGDWPTLADNRLFENRDLAPTLDIRSVFKGVLIEHMGLDRRAVDTAIFPDSAGAAPVIGLV